MRAKNAFSLGLSLCLALGAAGMQASFAQSKEGAASKESKEPTDLNKVLNINQPFKASEPTAEDLKVAADAHATEVANNERRNQALQHYEAAKNYLAAGQIEMADVELQAAIWKDADIKAFHRDYCLVALLHGHPMRALAEAVMVFGLGDPVALRQEQVNKLVATGCKLHYRRGIAFAKQSKWKDAIGEYQWALQYKPKNATVMRSMAFANASQGNIELAEKQYDSSFNGEPSEAYGRADFAYLLADNGNAQEAMKQLEAAVKLQPKVAALHIDLGWMAESKGNLGEAEVEFNEATRLSPDHAALWAHLGKVLSSEGKTKKRPPLTKRPPPSTRISVRPLNSGLFKRQMRLS